MGQAACPEDLTGSGVQQNNVLDPETRHCHLRTHEQKAWGLARRKELKRPTGQGGEGQLGRAVWSCQCVSCPHTIRLFYQFEIFQIKLFHKSR